MLVQTHKLIPAAELTEARGSETLGARRLAHLDSKRAKVPYAAAKLRITAFPQAKSDTSSVIKEPAKLRLQLISNELKSPFKVHHAELSFKADQISVSLDGKSLFTAVDSSHTHGMFAIGTGWNRAQFDNLSITPK